MLRWDDPNSDPAQDIADFAGAPCFGRQPSVTCAYERCQAGGVILPRAPRINATIPPWRHASGLFHPGCWAAEQRRRELP